jgi:hypothetical protein
MICTCSFTFDQSTFEAGPLALQATATAKELSSAAVAQLVVVQPAYAPALKVKVLAAEAGVLPTSAREWNARARQQYLHVPPFILTQAAVAELLNCGRHTAQTSRQRAFTVHALHCSAAHHGW